MRQVQALYGERGLKFAARRSNKDEDVSTLQETWAACVRAVSTQLECAQYSPTDFSTLAESLTHRLQEPAGLKDFQELFAEVGVKLVYIEAFPKLKLDGCSLLVEDNPVIGLSGRGKRLDKVFFTLMHEVAHVLLGHLDDSSTVILDNLDGVGGDKEAEADSLAQSLVIPAPLSALPAPIDRRVVKDYAGEIQVHPIVVIGRLQNEKKIGWNRLSQGAPQAHHYMEKWRAPIPVL